MVDNVLLAASLEGSDDARIPIVATSFEIGPLIDEAIDDSSVAPVAVTIDGDRHLTVTGDARVLRAGMTNLLDNVRKYGWPPFEIQWSLDETVLEISVRDHGEGVPAEFEGRLFDRFTQASVGDRRTATGLGLWITRRLAYAHGGDIAYEPATPGARFRLRIPLLDATAS